MFKNKLIKLLEESSRRKGAQLEHPTEASHGDYSANIAMTLAKEQGKNPMELAKKIVGELRVVRDLEELGVEKIEVAPPGFINFWLSQKALLEELEKARGEGWGLPAGRPGVGGREGVGGGRKVLVEFAHPNTHKLFHIGHLRNITLGEAVCRLLEFSGSTVVRANYQGDVGLHIAKAIWGLKRLGGIEKAGGNFGERIKFLAQAYAEGNGGYEGDGGGKKEIEEINKKLYEGDPKLKKLWQETRAWSLEYFDRIYKRVETHFDRLYFESEVADQGRKIVLESTGRVFEKSEGAIIFPGEKFGLHNRVFITSRGLPTYEAKDVGLAQLQMDEFSPYKIIHVVGPEQSGYFQVLFKALETLDPVFIGREEHLSYGWVRLKEGKMSSRTGDVVEGEWLLDEAKNRLQVKYKMPEDVAEKVGVGAVKYSMLKLSPPREIAFDLDESIKLEGDSGPYLQYTFARTQSVIEKAKMGDVRELGDVREVNPEELALLRTFYKFPEVVSEAAQNFVPNLLCNFLYDFATKYNRLYNSHRILEAESEEAKNLRLALTKVAGNILKTGLNLLGIEAPERM